MQAANRGTDSLLGEATIEVGINETQVWGFPPLPDEEIPKCGIWPGCNRTEYFAGFDKMPPSFGPYTTPTYSDISYQLLAYALENITGRKFQDMIEQDLFQKLGLKDTYYAAPNDTYGIIPGDRWRTSWAFHLGEEAPWVVPFSTSTLHRLADKQRFVHKERATTTPRPQTSQPSAAPSCAPHS